MEVAAAAVAAAAVAAAADAAEAARFAEDEAAAAANDAVEAEAVANGTAAGPHHGRRWRRRVGTSKRRRRVAFHVTGFGVFNGVPENPTTHLVRELPGRLRSRRGGEATAGPGMENADAAAPLPAFGGEGDGVFEVRSCAVLEVSAEVGGRQLREVHSASGAMGSRGSVEGAAAASAAAAVYEANGGGVIDGESSGSAFGSSTTDEGGSGAGNGHNRGTDASDDRESSNGVGGRTRGNEEEPAAARGSGGNTDDTDGDVSNDDEEDDGEGNGEGDDVVTVFVHCGVDGGASTFKLETQGFNEADFRVADEQGYRPSSAPIEAGLPVGHRRVTTVPVPDVLERLSAMGWGPEHVVDSEDAGRFVCNYVYYTSLGLCEAPAPVATVGAAGGEEALAQAAGTQSGEGLGGGGEDVFGCSEGAGSTASADAAGGDGSGDGGGHAMKNGDAGRPTTASGSRHSLFIHVPPFEVFAKEQQLSLLVSCLSAIAAAVSSPPKPPPPPQAAVDHEVHHFGTLAAAREESAPVVLSPPLSLSTYEAAILAADPETLSSHTSELPTSPSNVTAIVQNILPVDRAVPSAAALSIWDGQELAELSSPPPPPSAATEKDEAEGQKVVQFALDGLADIDGDGGGGDRSDDSEESEADATRRKLIEAGFDGLDVDAAMATTGSTDTGVNMGFLLDITSLLPHGAPTEADGLYAGESGNNGPDRDRGPGTEGRRRNGSETSSGGAGGGGGARAGRRDIRPRARPTASPARMGGVSPKWMRDVSPTRGGDVDDPVGAAKSNGGGRGGLLSRFRRGHRRAGSATSETTAHGGDGERSSEQRALSSASASGSSSWLKGASSANGSPPPAPVEYEYTRRTTGMVAAATRSMSPLRVPLGLRSGAGGAGRGAAGSSAAAAATAAAAPGWGEAAPTGPNLRLALLVRLDLAMGPGELAAQCARAALAAARKAEGGGGANTVAVWREAGESIVVLGAADAGRLGTILEVAAASNLSITMVRDKQPPWVNTRHARADTCTVAALGPAPMSALRAVVGGLLVL